MFNMEKKRKNKINNFSCATSEIMRQKSWPMNIDKMRFPLLSLIVEIHNMVMSVQVSNYAPQTFIITYSMFTMGKKIKWNEK